MLRKLYVDALFGEAPAGTAILTVTGALHSVGGDVFGAIVQPCHAVTLPQIGRNNGTGPGRENHGEIGGEVDASDHVPLLRKGEEIGMGCTGCDPCPHGGIFTGHKVACDVKPEKPGCIHAGEITGKLGLHNVKMIDCDVGIGAPGVADVAIHPVGFHSVTAASEAGFAGLGAAGAAGCQAQIGNGADFAVTVGDLDGIIVRHK